MKSDLRSLYKLCGYFAIVGAVATLLYTIGWMIWYEQTTGYSAGNAPAFWIIFYGPAGAVIGALIGLIVWLFNWLINKLNNGRNN